MRSIYIKLYKYIHTASLTAHVQCMYDLLLEASKAEPNLALLVKTCSLNDYDIIRVSCGCRQADWELPHSSTVTAAHVELSCTTAHETNIMVGSAISGQLFELVSFLQQRIHTTCCHTTTKLLELHKVHQNHCGFAALQHQRFISHFITTNVFHMHTFSNATRLGLQYG